MKIRKTVQVIDKEHKRSGEFGTLMSQEGDKCLVRFVNAGGPYKYGARDANKLLPFVEEELDMSQLKQEEA